MAKFEFENNPKMNKAIKWFVVNLLIMFASILIIMGINTFMPDNSLADLSMPLIVIFYGVAGIGSAKISGMDFKTIGKHFLKGVMTISPAVIMLLLAASIRYILAEGLVLDTILYRSTGLIGTAPPWAAILLVYAVVLLVNFFIPSGSAKAILLMPLIWGIISATPTLAANITGETAVLAFLFGDGFSNVFFPTNPVLLISLGLTTVSYGKWIRWSWKFQLVLLSVLCLILLGVAAI
jgi:uncharacterized ion transporter superfamily protein YfcC